MRVGSLPIGIALLLSPVSASLAADPPPTHIIGFRSSDVTAELAREAQAAASVRADTLRRHLRILTAEPHVAGTPADHATAEYVRQRLEAYGWQAWIEPVPVYLNYPGPATLELLEPQPTPLSLHEAGVPWDKDAFDRAAYDAFNGYAAAGDVTARVVYANYADVDDLKKLADMGIDVRGKIVLARYGKIFRGLKVRNAEKAGAAAVVIYSDPADDGYMQGDPYPRGVERPSDAIQRGSVQFLSESPGDPSTPGWASGAKSKRLARAQMKGIPSVPSIPIAYGEAQKILEALEGPAVPKGWQGGLPFTYHVGPGPAKAHLKTEQSYAVRPIWNVFAKLAGRERPDEWVMCGNHRDAWTFGAIDPNSGTIAMLEMARAIGTLANSGWRPRRTIVLGSWDGEEYGLLGSTEWCEALTPADAARIVAYVNVDAAVSGKDFRCNGTHALSDMLIETLGVVTDPGKGTSVAQAWRDRAFGDGKADWARRERERRWRGEPSRPFRVDVTPVGSGSDYTAFVDHLGIPVLDIRFEGDQGTYHSRYDDFEYADRIVDPGYVYHQTLVNVWSRLTLRLAEAELLPLRYSNTGQFVLDELQATSERADDANAGVEDTTKLMTADLAPARSAATRLRDDARALEQRADAALEGAGWPGGSAVATNAALMQVDRALLGPGLPGRPWFRHELYAPGLNTGYAGVPLPRLGQAVLDKDRAAYRMGVAPLVDVLDRAAATLERLR